MQQDRAMMQDALRARDSALGLLVDACHRIREKANAIQILEAFNTELEIRISTAGLQALCLGHEPNRDVRLAYTAVGSQADERRAPPTLARSTYPSFETFRSNASESTTRSRVSSVTTVYDADPAGFDNTVCVILYCFPMVQ
jgi:hypothetical protein